MVKALAFVVLAVSLVLGLMGAMTAYTPPLALPDERLVGLTLNAPAGVKTADDGSRSPLARQGDRLTPELLAALRASGESRVRVKEFAADRWTGMPWFLAGFVGLLVGGWIARREARRDARRALPGAEGGASAAGAPELTLEAIAAAVGRLRSELPAMDDRARKLERILAELSIVQETHVPAFAAARPQLVSRLGIAGYARLMDRFAAGERQVNRAWSAACDGYLEESVDCLEAAAVRIAEAEDRLA